MITLTTPKIGDRMAFRKTMTVAEQAMFTGISGNLAPLHVDQRAARAAGFDGMLAFEFAVLALASTALNRLAGPGWRIGGLQLGLPSATLVGETVEASVEVMAVADAAFTCQLTCTLGTGETVIAGTATLVPATPRD
jgi:acyl dehydratase